MVFGTVVGVGRIFFQRMADPCANTIRTLERCVVDRQRHRLDFSRTHRAGIDFGRHCAGCRIDGPGIQLADAGLDSSRRRHGAAVEFAVASAAARVVPAAHSESEPWGDGRSAVCPLAPEPRDAGDITAGAAGAAGDCDAPYRRPDQPRSRCNPRRVGRRADDFSHAALRVRCGFADRGLHGIRGRGLTHSFLFFLIALVYVLSPRPCAVPVARRALGLGATFGWTAYSWVTRHTGPEDLFVTELQHASLNPASLAVMAAGRRSVALPETYSNPYVEWQARTRLNSE